MKDEVHYWFQCLREHILFSHIVSWNNKKSALYDVVAFCFILRMTTHRDIVAEQFLCKTDMENIIKFLIDKHYTIDNINNEER